ncbi:hypothetical protein QFZ66_005853 [Streptomyces sp. B4I13]|uniref:hypothetical protein n=1 Tax=Streptomyces sp. B4I13 TaxID=3042271 RepID=UPI002782C87F|nr:hypothetical protein [Streptomyces sp. B4I13]MDQ0961975.1 hypothetical protein [Streptomyces sp. B4I13]
MNEVDEGETKVRAALRRLGARPAGHAPAEDAEQQPTPVAVVIPPRPDYDPDVAVPGPRRALAPRLPDWRDPHKPELDTVDDGQEPDDADASEESEEQPGESRRHRLLRIVKGERDQPDSDDEQPAPKPRQVSKGPADQGEEAEEDAEEDLDEVRRVGEGRGRRFRLDVQESSQRPRFSTPVFPRHEQERKSLAQAWGEVHPSKKFALYNLTGLAGGLFFGIVGYATEITRSIADSPLPMRDNSAAYFWGAGAVLVLAVDRATRKWAWLVGWCTRGITVSVIVGALLHGNTVGEAVANMPTILDRLSDQP